MFKWIIIVVAIYIVYKLFANDFKKKIKSKDEENKQKVNSGEMIKDPICGTYVEKKSSLTVKDNEKVYYFCSYECRDIFLSKQKELTENDQK